MSYTYNQLISDIQSFQEQYNNEIETARNSFVNAMSKENISDDEVLEAVALYVQAGLQAMANAANTIANSSVDPTALVIWQGIATDSTTTASIMPGELSMENVGDWMPVLNDLLTRDEATRELQLSNIQYETENLVKGHLPYVYWPFTPGTPGGPSIPPGGPSIPPGGPGFMKYINLGLLMGCNYITNMDKINNLFSTAETVISPIIIDLDGDGVETTGLNTGTYFDHDGNGFAEQTAWVSADDGFLVYDRDGNGKIDTGKELFGNETLLADGTKASNGFQALAELDANTDGKIDVNDADYSQLKIWQDTDGDGIASSDELHTLAELNIASINTGYSDSTLVDANGNAHNQIGAFTKTDGSTGAAEDVWFKADTMYTIAEEWLDVPADIAALPDAQGYGNVYDLHQAMVRDTSDQLKSLVGQFAAATDVATRNSLIDQIIYEWTGSDEIDPTSRGAYIDARKLVALEKFMGENYEGTWCDGTLDPNPNSHAAPLLLEAYQELSEMVYAQLMAQTHLKSLYGLIAYSWDENTQTMKGDLTSVAQNILIQLADNADAGKQTLSEFVRTLNGLSEEDTMNYDQFRNVFASQGNEILDFIDNADTNPLHGTTGNDTITGTTANDTIYGFEGNDTLAGGNGSDTYKFGIGSGVDTIKNGDYATDYATATDTVEFGSVILASDMELVKEGNNLRININGTTDTLIISNWFSSISYQPDQFRFADGTVLTAAQVHALGYKIYGTENADVLSGSNANDTIYGYDGNDTLYGNEGNDVLDGASGNDYFEGGNGDDIYKFGIGSGVETINNYATDYATATDTVEFGSGITVADMELVKEGNNLRININGTTDTLIISNWFSSISYQPDQFKFTDGTVLTASQVHALGYKIYGTANADSLSGTNGNEMIYGYDGNDSLYGNEGNDVLYGGAGNDSLIGGAGNDTLDGASGNDYFEGGNGDDIYKFGIGSGVETINNYATDYATATDTVEFGTGIAASDMELVKEGNNLRININGATDSLIIYNWFSSVSYQPDQFRFADGTVLTAAQVDALGYKMYGTVNADNLSGSEANDTMYGYDGNDSLYGNEGNDVLYGASGNDSLIGGAGNDTLDGGVGNDSLEGGNSNDTYMFRRTDGQDVVTETTGVSGDTDTVKMTDGITETEPVIVKQNNDLYIFIDTNNYVKVTNEFYQANYGIERLEVTDGYYITRSDIENIVNTMSAINNDPGMDVIQKYNAMRVDQTYINTLAQSWHQT